MNRFNAHGQATGVCLVTVASGVCYDDADPASPTEIGWLLTEAYAFDAEAETGTRTIFAAGATGVACWDWVTLAPCTGGGYDQWGRRQRRRRLRTSMGLRDRV